MLDVNQRYQTALEMKRDIDAILFRYFEMPGSFSTGSISGYTLPTPSSIRQIPASGPVSVYQSGHMQQQQFYEPTLSQSANHSPLSTYQPIDMYDRSRHQSSLHQLSTDT